MKEMDERRIEEDLGIAFGQERLDLGDFVKLELGYDVLNEEEVSFISEYIEIYPFIKDFTLPYLEDNHQTTRILQSLLHNRSIKRLSVDSSLFTSEMFEYLVEFTLNSPKLESLCVQDDCIPKDLTLLFSAIKERKSLTDLDLQVNIISEREGFELYLAALECKGLTKLSVPQINTEAGLQKVFCALPRVITSVREFDMSNFCLEEEALQELSVSIKNAPNLTCLRINTEGRLESIEEALMKNTTLTSLSLDFTLVEQCEEVFLHTFLKSNTSLKTFALSGFDGCFDFTSIFSAMEYNTTLTELGCRGNQDGVNKSRKNGFCFLNKNSTLRALSFSRNCCHVTEELTDLIRANTPLRIIDIRHNELKEGDEMKILEAVTINNNLFHLGYSGESMHKDIVFLVQEELRKNKKFVERNNQTKMAMLVLQRRKGNLVSNVPRRLLLFLLSFLDSLPKEFYDRNRVKVKKRKVGWWKQNK